MIKKFKKIVSVTLASAMLLCTNAFAAYTDVPEDSDVYSAVETLSTLGILNGYEDNTFKPDGNITRAEMCAVLCRALGLEAPETFYYDYSFTDVPRDHWAYWYVALCKEHDIVDGMGNDIFAPDSSVTLSQAVKMILSAMGYGILAESNGGWPAGYVSTAAKYGILDGITEKTDSPATRATVAKLLDNALPAPVVLTSGNPTTGFTLEIADGTGTFPYSSLLSDLGIVKISGSIVGTSEKEYNGSKCDDGEVIYRFNNAKGNEFLENYLSEKADKDKYATFTFKYESGVPVSKYSDTPSEIFVKKLSNDNPFDIFVNKHADDTYMIIDIRPVKEK